MTMFICQQRLERVRLELERVAAAEKAKKLAEEVQLDTVQYSAMLTYFLHHHLYLVSACFLTSFCSLL